MGWRISAWTRRLLWIRENGRGGVSISGVGKMKGGEGENVPSPILAIPKRLAAFSTSLLSCASRSIRHLAIGSSSHSPLSSSSSCNCQEHHHIFVSITLLCLCVRAGKCTYIKTLFTTQSLFFLLFSDLLLDGLLLAWWQDGGGLGCFWLRVFFFPVVLPIQQT